jgi:hypothetical protein
VREEDVVPKDQFKSEDESRRDESWWGIAGATGSRWGIADVTGNQWGIAGSTGRLIASLHRPGSRSEA